MKTKFAWTKGIFSSTYKIYSDHKIIGYLMDKTFSQSSLAELNGKKYTFINTGFFKHHTKIYDSLGNNVLIGNIEYNNWRTKATLTFQDKKIYWKYNNVWNTKWSIFSSEGIEINYSGSSTAGKIDSNIDNDLFILSGLFITNYYWQRAVGLIVAIIIPVWFAANN